ncbi:MAG TPA: hypothetical protein VIU64_02595 [Polyangia bacterium]
METLRLASSDRRRLVSGRRWLLGLGVIALSIVGCGISKPSAPLDGGGLSSGSGGAAGFGGGITEGHGGSIGSGGNTQAGAGGEPSGGGQAGAGGGGQAGAGGAGEPSTIVTGLQYDGAIRFLREVP